MGCEKNKELIIQRSIRKTLRMCNNRQKMKDQGLPNWQGLYPDLSALFNQQNQQNANTTNTRPSFFSILLGLLGIDTSSYTSPTQGQWAPNPQFSGPSQGQPSPSAPPPSPGPTPSSGGDYFSQGRQANRCNCNGHHEPEILPLLIARVLKFSRIFTRGFILFLVTLMFVSTISLLLNTLIYNAAFFLLAGGLGLHLPTLVAGHVLYALFCCFDPFFLALVSLWAGHKTMIRRKPLIDVNLWKRRLAGTHTN